MTRPLSKTCVEAAKPSLGGRCKQVAFAMTTGAALLLSGCGESSDTTDNSDVITTDSGLKIEITHHGDGAVPEPGNVVIAHYTGKLTNGEVFDSSRERDQPFAFTLGAHEVIKGWDEGFAQLRVGDEAILTIPPELGYGSRDIDGIPPNSTLIFDVTFVDLMEHSLATALKEKIDEDGIEAANEFLDGLRADGFGDFYVIESQLNGLGYRYLQDEETDKAIAVFQWNTELYPDSGNAYDSLGEGYANAGEVDLAIANYRRSLEIDPSNENAAKMIEKLESQEE